VDADAVKRLVADQVSRIRDVSRREALEAVLIEPDLQFRDWSYGEQPQEYPCWVIARVRQRPTVLLYCEHGFGPSYPWGILHAEDCSLGTDGQWHQSLDDAFLNSGGWTGPFPPNYETP
jgi:hypothetical protein